MAFRIKGSHITALLLAGGLAAWMATGEIDAGGRASDEIQPPVAEREAARDETLFKVRYVELQPQARAEQVVVRGRTKASATIPIRAETAGILEKRLVEKGQRVKPGDEVCRIETGVRQTRIAQAQAQLAQAQADYEANQQLSERGFASQNKLNQMRFALDSAKAVLAEAEWEMERTVVRANASGIVQDPVAEPGDMLSMGATCVTLIDTDPMLFTGQISERDIAKVETGMAAKVTLVTGETFEGRLRYIAPSADAQTRTFESEIEIANPEAGIRDGMTATARVEIRPQIAFRVSPSWLTLSDDGRIGLRIADEEDRVRFVEVAVVAQTNDGFWVTGPQPGMRAITVGHEYVLTGAKVDPQPDPMLKADLPANQQVNQ
jgi:multidrug efflux system membrane fusion protein